MGRRFKLVREQAAIWIGAALGLAALAAGMAWLGLARETPARDPGEARIELPLPLELARHAPPDDSPSDAAKDVERIPPDGALLEDGPFGPLPRIAPDGRRPFLAYALPFNLEDKRPKVAVLLVGLGLQWKLVDAALSLPLPIALQFSPYAPDLPAMVARARAAGHEVLLELPWGSADNIASDPGHYTVLDAGVDEHLRRLDWALAQASGYFALAGDAPGSSADDQAEAALDVLARRGLALIELSDNRLAPVAAAAGLPYATARHTVDQDPSVPAIDHAIAAVEAEALATGSAVAVARGHPASLDRLRRWAATLGPKGLVLAPVSAVLIEQAGLARGLPTDGHRAAQSER
jgi:polysaccharide deacetylase 2 family uncharacterized protein YibQ